MSDSDRLVGVRLRVDLGEPIDGPTTSELATEVRRLVHRHTYGLTLERVGVAGAPSIDCVSTPVGWYLTRRGQVATDVAQGHFESEAAALRALVIWATEAEGWLVAHEFRPVHPEPFPSIDTEAHHWARSEHEKAERVYFYEFNPDGMVLRVVTLKGPKRSPYAAASLMEWRECQRGLMQPVTPDTRRYELHFGSVPEGTEADWGDYPRDNIASDEFERIWAHAREHLGPKEPETLQILNCGVVGEEHLGCRSDAGRGGRRRRPF